MHLINIIVTYDLNHPARGEAAIFLDKFLPMNDFNFNPLRKILVPTDFSENAEHALSYAAMLAAKLRSKLVLLHSIKVPIVAMNEMVAEVPEPQLTKEANLQLEKLKNKIRGRQLPVEVETISSMGFAVEEIISFCDERKSDLIVMGTRGAHGLSEVLLGSNTAEVISKAACPVLAVPYDAPVNGIRKILFATNYNDNDFRSIFLLTEIFKPWNPEIIIVHAEDSHHPRMENSAFEHFKEQVVSGIPYDKYYFNLLDGGDVESAVNDFASSNQVDLISVSKRKRNFFERMIGTSLSKRLAYHTHIPLLVFQGA